MNEWTKKRGCREKKLFSKNTKRSILQPFIHFRQQRNSSEEGRREWRAEEDMKKKKKHPSHWSEIRKLSVILYVLPAATLSQWACTLGLGHFDEIKAQASLWLNRMGALTQPVSDWPLKPLMNGPVRGETIKSNMKQSRCDGPVWQSKPIPPLHYIAHGSFYNP